MFSSERINTLNSFKLGYKFQNTSTTGESQKNIHLLVHVLITINARTMNTKLIHGDILALQFEA